MADNSNKPSDPGEPLLFRLHIEAGEPHPYSPEGGGGPGRFVCPTPAGAAPPMSDFYQAGGPVAWQDQGQVGWWDTFEEWWTGVKDNWNKTQAEIERYRRQAAQVYEALGLAFDYDLLLSAMWEQTGLVVTSVPAIFIEGLKDCVKTIVGFTLAGAGIGAVLTIPAGGAGALPGSKLGFEAGLIYIQVKGLALITQHVAKNLGQAMVYVNSGVVRAWNAGQRGAPRSVDIKEAAWSFDLAIGVIFRLVMEAIVLLIIAKGASATLSALGESQFGKGFAAWVEQNQKALLNNPKLNPGLKGKAGAKTAAAEGASAPKSPGGAPKPDQGPAAAAKEAAKAKKAETLKKNKEKGKAREDEVRKELEAEGHEVLGSQVSVKTPQTRRVTDHLIRDGQTGKVRAIEVKSGNATRDALQKAKDGSMESEGGTIIGKNAPAQLRGQKLKIPTEVRK